MCQMGPISHGKENFWGHNWAYLGVSAVDIAYLSYVKLFAKGSSDLVVDPDMVH